MDPEKARQDLRKKRRRSVMKMAKLPTPSSSSDSECELDLNYSFREDGPNAEADSLPIKFWADERIIRHTYNEKYAVISGKKSLPPSFFEAYYAMPRNSPDLKNLKASASGKDGSIIFRADVHKCIRFKTDNKFPENFLRITNHEQVLNMFHRVCSKFTDNETERGSNREFAKNVFECLYQNLELSIEERYMTDQLLPHLKSIVNNVDLWQGKSSEEMKAERVWNCPEEGEAGKRPDFCLDVFPDQKSAGRLEISEFKNYKKWQQVAGDFKKTVGRLYPQDTEVVDVN